MSLRARKRRHLRRHPPKAPVLVEAARLPAYDRALEHRRYSAHAQSGLFDLAQRGLLVLREPLRHIPFGV